MNVVPHRKRSRYSDGLWAGRPGFDIRQTKDFSLLHNFQIGSGAHPASYPMGNGGDFAAGIAAGT
jgi:hypothetical protein